ncbi:uncharacterized protein LOC118346304 [Juglans regia]|uniref:Uncharacterized protein LOC118346304 n=1 Tax=Juglans regia TaxID=51240 RepID=A0A6P9EFS2_JUGRE|nr:uncharacterized protein LOC118346304 [Juglans regia]
MPEEDMVPESAKGNIVNTLVSVRRQLALLNEKGAFCLWDHFKELESMQHTRSLHLAKFAAEMLASFTLSLAVLKSVELGDIRLTMTRAWRPVRGMCFRDLNANLFLVEFEDLRDKERVLREGPWSFDKQLVLVQEVDGSKQVHQIKIQEATFWVRIHDLPLRARNAYVGERIGKKIGKVEEVDLAKGEVAWGEFLQVRITLDVMKPLLRGTKFTMGNGESCWVRFSYERLPNFCYLCGCLGHGDRECGLRQTAAEGDNMGSVPYGAWLRASSYGDHYRAGRSWDRRELNRQEGHPKGRSGGVAGTANTVLPMPSNSAPNPEFNEPNVYANATSKERSLAETMHGDENTRKVANGSEFQG